MEEMLTKWVLGSGFWVPGQRGSRNLVWVWWMHFIKKAGLGQGPGTKLIRVDREWTRIKDNRSLSRILGVGDHFFFENERKKKGGRRHNRRTAPCFFGSGFVRMLYTLGGMGALLRHVQLFLFFLDKMNE